MFISIHQFLFHSLQQSSVVLPPPSLMGRWLVQTLPGAPASVTPATKVTSYPCPPCWHVRATATGVGRSPSASVSGTKLDRPITLDVTDKCVQYTGDIFQVKRQSFGKWSIWKIKRFVGSPQIVLFILYSSVGSCFLWRPRDTCPGEEGGQRLHLPLLCLLLLLLSPRARGLQQEILSVWWHLEWHATLLHRYVFPPFDLKSPLASLCINTLYN